MNRADSLRFMNDPRLWPLRVVLPLAHETRRDAWGTPACALLAYGHGSVLYLENLDAFAAGETTNRHRFELALRRFKSISYLSLDAIVGDGWRVD